jgi:hypothetical protein
VTQPLIGGAGEGKVVYVPSPVELVPSDRLDQIYRHVLRRAGVDFADLTVNGDQVHVLSLPTRDGGRLTVLVRADEAQGESRVTLPAHRVSLFLKPMGCAFVLTNGRGEVLAAESEGELRLDGKVVAKANGHYALVSLDGQGLTRSKRILVLPHQQRAVNLYLHPRGRYAVRPLSEVSSAHMERRTLPVIHFGVGEVAIVEAL